ncbi:MAG: histidinol-phosphate transaminase [Acidimicrobiales bacterium]
MRPADNLGPLEGYHSPQVAVTVRLNTNESPYPPPAGWVAALAAEVGRTDFHRYPDRRAGALRAALGELHGVGPDRVFAANGSNEVIQTLLLTYGGPGRAAAVFEPTYAMHSQIARVTSTAVALGSRQPDFALDLTEVKRVLEALGPALVFLCSPNNPTGRLDPPEVVAEVLELVEGSAGGGLVVVDEAYGQFSSWSALTMVERDRPLVVLRTFSKTWAMAGLRLGYLVGPPAVVEALEARALPYHLDVLKQVAGRLALSFRAEMEARVAAIVAERCRLVAALEPLAVEVTPSEANFVLFRPLHRPAGAVWAALVERSVLVRDCSGWPAVEGCLRVTVGTPGEDDAFLAALGEVLA